MGDSFVQELIFLGTGTSAGVPAIECLTDPETSCNTCISTRTKAGEVNIRGNTSLVIRVNHPDGNLRTVVIDCGKTFYVSALKWFPYHKLRRIDAVILTHPHADAINGLDDLRAWTLKGVVQDHIPIYLANDTMRTVQQAFPYMIDQTKAAGSGRIPAFQFHEIDINVPFTVEGLEFTPLPVHHGIEFGSMKPFICLGFRFENITYISDCNYIPEETREKIHGSEVLIIDGLDRDRHSSHFSIYQGIDTARGLNPKPKRTYLVGFTHVVEHYDMEREMQELQEKEPDLWVRPAYDGLKVDRNGTQVES